MTLGLAAISAVAMSSCSDFLDEGPKTSLPEDIIYSDTAYVESNVQTLYKNWRGLFTDRYLWEQMVGTDEIQSGAYQALKEDGGTDKFDIVVPSLSILAEPPVAVVDKNAEKKGNTEIAKAYLEHLYSPAGQEIAAKNFYRPRDAAVAAKYAQQFPKLELVTIDKDFGGWKTAQPKFFNDGGVFDQIYQAQ